MTDEQKGPEGRKQRAAKYRMLAQEAEDMAVKALSQKIREGFLTLASGWHKRADEVDPDG